MGFEKLGGNGSCLACFVGVGVFFIIAGAFTFGSGLAIVPFLHQGVVLDHHWLNERQFLDAVAGMLLYGPMTKMLSIG